MPFDGDLDYVTCCSPVSRKNRVSICFYSVESTPISRHISMIIHDKLKSLTAFPPRTASRSCSSHPSAESIAPRFSTTDFQASYFFSSERGGKKG